MTQQKIRSIRPAALVVVLTVLSAVSATAESAADLAGIWGATRDFGPEVRGALTLSRSESGWRAEIGGFSVDVTVSGGEIEFEIPGDRGRFSGLLDTTGDRIKGHWTQPPTANNGMRFTSAVELVAAGTDRWRGQVVPWDDGFRFYLVLTPREDGSLGAFFRNPERNLGVFLNLDRLERDGDRVELLGTWLRNKNERVLADGIYRPNFDHRSIYIPRGHGTYDFERIDADPSSFFYPRGRKPSAYTYRPPPALEDGWPVGTLEDGGISAEPIR